MNPSREEVFRIITELDLLSCLTKYGEAQVVGSVALDLIVKPDLDSHLLIDAEDLMPTVHAVTGCLLDQPRVHEVRISNWRKGNGVKIGWMPTRCHPAIGALISGSPTTGAQRPLILSGS